MPTSTSPIQLLDVLRGNNDDHIALIHNHGIFISREDKLRGFSTPVSAISKKSAKKGKQIEGMDDGWIDMEQYDDDDGPKSPKK